MTITWLGQSGYLLEAEAVRIFIDPYLSDVVNRVAGRPRLIPPPILPEVVSGAVICTHDHLDHLDPDAIVRMHRERIDFYAPSSCRRHLEELGCSRIYALDVGDKVQLGPFLLTAVFADHTVDAIGILAEWDGHRFYFTGDTLWNPRLAEMVQYQPDFLFVCINGKLGNMNVEEAVRLNQMMRPRVAIPTHYGMFASNTEDPKTFTAQIPNGVILELGKAVTPGELLAMAAGFDWEGITDGI